MKISQSLPKPENWQDFENLCKKLWGEIWSCAEIKKNGRSGQNQAGIDVYGIPKGEISYFGIQCKGKDEYTNKQLLEKEINEEIEKAKKFEPSLKKMYFATTAVKDVVAETVIRKKNIEHLKQGIFEVHLYSWEDIVDLIFENKTTYDYYLNSQTFKKSQSVNVTFKNGETEMTVNPKFLQKIRVARTKYEQMEQQAKELMPDWIEKMVDKHWITPEIFSTSFSNSPKQTEFNRSFFEGTILVTNNGSDPLEHWKLTLSLPEDINEISYKNCEKKGSYIISGLKNVHFDTFINSESNIITIEPRKKILVGDDSFESDSLFYKPNPKKSSIKIPWKLVSKDFKEKGFLTLHIEPKIESERIKVDDNSPLLLDENKRITIEDFFETVVESE
ncbi:hypothetical protein [Algibacter luteus]|uniref:hypothetical protein n=1 Tax=Algibacter luteus TaxID=1178825 RepID=UPI0025989294|nr:hypothetical protein [Algibacter luteus]WJJ96397.1 hypothetical protein O5O44_14375 [Algibacter luteus]